MRPNWITKNKVEDLCTARGIQAVERRESDNRRQEVVLILVAEDGFDFGNGKTQVICRNMRDFEKKFKMYGNIVRKKFDSHVWDGVESRYKYVAVDEMGTVHYFVEKPWWDRKWRNSIRDVKVTRREYEVPRGWKHFVYDRNWKRVEDVKIVERPHLKKKDNVVQTEELIKTLDGKVFEGQDVCFRYATVDSDGRAMLWTKAPMRDADGNWSMLRKGEKKELPGVYVPFDGMLERVDSEQQESRKQAFHKSILERLREWRRSKKSPPKSKTVSFIVDMEVPWEEWEEATRWDEPKRAAYLMMKAFEQELSGISEKMKITCRKLVED